MSRGVKGLPAVLRRELDRTNFAGRSVSLGEGGLVALAATTSAFRVRVSDGVALAGISVLGLADDLLEPRSRRAGRPVSKGLRGHARALRSGHPTTGAAKALGIPVLCLVAAATGPQETTGGDGDGGPHARRTRRALSILIDGAVAASSANMANLLDLRPGRALKVLVPSATVAMLGDTRSDRARSGRALGVRAAVIGLAALPADLREHGMLGDTGANVLGALVGTAATRRLPLKGRVVLLTGLGALTLLSEKVSFSAVIERNPVLRALDRIGRLPVVGPAAQDPPAAPAAGHEDTVGLTTREDGS